MNRENPEEFLKILKKILSFFPIIRLRTEIWTRIAVKVRILDREAWTNKRSIIKFCKVNGKYLEKYSSILYESELRSKDARGSTDYYYLQNLQYKIFGEKFRLRIIRIFYIIREFVFLRFV